MKVPETVDQLEAAHGLPDLLGTERQIPFARDMRFRYMVQAYRLAESLDPEGRRELREYLAPVKEYRATWFWIAKRGAELAGDFTKARERAKRWATPRLADHQNPVKTENPTVAPGKPRSAAWKRNVSRAYLLTGMAG